MRLGLLDLSMWQYYFTLYFLRRPTGCGCPHTLKRSDRPIPAGLAQKWFPPHLSSYGSILNAIEENRQVGESAAQPGGRQDQETEGPSPWLEACRVKETHQPNLVKQFQNARDGWPLFPDACSLANCVGCCLKARDSKNSEDSRVPACLPTEHMARMCGHPRGPGQA